MNNSNKIDAPHGKIADHVKEKARFAHLRSTHPMRALDYVDVPQSPGATIAFMDEGDNYYAGVAYCNPADNFSKATGRIKSTGRLIQTVLGTADEGDGSFMHFEGDNETYDDFNAFKAETIDRVAFHGNYNVLPGPKNKKEKK